MRFIIVSFFFLLIIAVIVTGIVYFRNHTGVEQPGPAIKLNIPPAASNVTEHVAVTPPPLLPLCPICKGEKELTATEPVNDGKERVPCWACLGQGVLDYSLMQKTFLDEKGVPDPAVRLSFSGVTDPEFPFLLWDTPSDPSSGQIQFSDPKKGTYFYLKPGDTFPAPAEHGFMLISQHVREETREDPTIRDAEGHPYRKTVKVDFVEIQSPRGIVFTLDKQKMGSTHEYLARLTYLPDNRTFTVRDGEPFKIREQEYQLAAPPATAQDTEIRIVNRGSGREFVIRPPEESVKTPAS